MISHRCTGMGCFVCNQGYFSFQPLSEERVREICREEIDSRLKAFEQRIFGPQGMEQPKSKDTPKPEAKLLTKAEIAMAWNHLGTKGYFESSTGYRFELLCKELGFEED